MSSNNIYELQHPDFIQNKYFYLYLKILSKPDTTGYTEKHHILPKSMGGSDSKTNLIQITSRKHFLAHYLLTKCVKQKTPSWYSMVKAFNMMNSSSRTQQRYINSRLYESNRKHMTETMSVLQTGENSSQFGSKWIHHPYTKHVMKIKNTEPIPFGYKIGRSVKCVGFDLYVLNESKILKKLATEQLKNEELKNNIQCFNYLHDIYCKYGLAGVISAGYTFTGTNLIYDFRKYVPEYIPQRGCKR